MDIACFQLDIAWEDKAANYRKVEAMARAAELKPGTLVVLPEMFATGFSMNAAAIAEPADGPTAQFLAKLAADHQSYVIGGLVLANAAGKPKNEALVFGPDG